jgi:folylpolyglutamate synthase/dihydropteroate synthase
MAFLNNPQQPICGPSTLRVPKGKGSVAAMCAACLRAGGLRVGLYTSPHVMEFRERIRILTPDDEDGRIPPADLIRLVNQLQAGHCHLPRKLPGLKL